MVVIGDHTAKFYSWERDIVFPFVSVTSPRGLQLIEPFDGQKFLISIFNNHPSGPPLLRISKSMLTRIDFLKWQLFIPKNHLRPVLILHECANLLTFGGDEEEFIQEYISLLDHYLFIKKGALLLTLKDYNL